MKSIGIKKILLVSMCIFLQTFSNAQLNLVPDPSFEDTSLNNCGGQESLICWNNLDSNKFNSCLFGYFSTKSIGGCTLPSNGWFYQNPRSGNGVIEALVYWKMFPPQSSYIRSVPRAKLKTSLIAGKQYCARMYVSPFETETYFTNGIGMYFDNGQLDTIVAQDSSGIYPFVNPQVQCSFIIDDTLNWKAVEGIFTATGNETFLTIGNFLSDSNTQKSYCNTSAFCECSDLIIDDVSVVPIEVSNWLHDTSCILGDSVYIGLTDYEFPDGMWFDINMNFIKKASGFKVKPTQWATQYIMQLDLCGTIRSDTLTVWAAPVGVRDVSKGVGLEVFPNPANGEFEIRYINKKGYCALYDAIGRCVKQIPLLSRSVKVDVSDLEKGVYYLKLDGVCKKILIE